jgi:hypothetical protein
VKYEYAEEGEEGERESSTMELVNFGTDAASLLESYLP